jgi:hypothetical protein
VAFGKMSLSQIFKRDIFCFVYQKGDRLLKCLTFFFLRMWRIKKKVYDLLHDSGFRSPASKGTNPNYIKK